MASKREKFNPLVTISIFRHANTRSQSFRSILILIARKDGMDVIMNIGDLGLYDAFVDGLDLLAMTMVQLSSNVGNLSFFHSSLASVISAIPTTIDKDYKGFFTKDDLDISISTLDKIDLQTRLSELEDRCRNFNQILDNSSGCYNEAIVYSVEKFVDNDTGTLEQLFQFAGKSEVINFIDTQVKRGEKYVYRVSAFIVIYGTTYTYDNIIFDDSDGAYTVDFEVSTASAATVFKVPLFTKSVTVSAPPPMTPEVKFLNNSDSNNSLKIYFDAKEGQERADFRPLMSSDLELLDLMEYDQEGKVLFQTLNENLEYTIYRMDKRPVNKTQFKDYFYDVVTNFTPGQSEIYQMNIAPNKKYYFLFRARNDFGLFSNCTPVYEVELIRDADSTRIITNTVQFEEETRQQNRHFRRFLQIIPAPQQTIISSIIGDDQSVDTVTDVDSYTLGVVDKSVWSRKFKLRIRSNNTGKIVDLNVNFNLLKKKTEEDFV